MNNLLKAHPFQIILISVFALVAVVGLFVFSTFSGFGNKAADIGTVRIWGTLPSGAVEDAIATLRQTHKEYANVTYAQRPEPTFDADLANALASGSGPDLILITQEQLLTESARLELIPFASLPQRTFLDTFVSLDELYLTDAGSFAVPLTVDPLVLYYNRTLLSSAGIATPPTTWEAVTGLAPIMTKQDSGKISKSTIAFGSYSNVTNARAVLSLLMLQAGSPITRPGAQGLRSVLSEAPSGGSAPAVAAVNFYTQFANPSLSTYSWNPSLPPSRQAFISGDLAFYIGFASERAALTAANPNLDFDMAAIPQPSTASGGRATYGLAYGLAIPKASANKTGAFSTAVSLAAADVAGKLASTLGMAPARRALLTPSTSDRFASIYYPQALIAKGWLSPAGSAVDNIFAAMISNMTTGRYDATQAVSVADQSINALISQ